MRLQDEIETAVARMKPGTLTVLLIGAIALIPLELGVGALEAGYEGIRSAGLYLNKRIRGNSRYE